MMADVIGRRGPSGAELASFDTDAGELGALHDVFSAGDAEAFSQVIAAASEPRNFVTRSDEAQQRCRIALRSAYRAAMQSLRPHGSHAVAIAVPAPAELVTQDFHIEQIWAQIDMLNSVGMKRVRKLMKHMADDVELLDDSMEEAVDELLAGGAPGMADGTSSDDTDQIQRGSRDVADDEDGDSRGAEEQVDFDAMLAAGRQRDETMTSGDDKGSDEFGSAADEETDHDGSDDDGTADDGHEGNDEDEKELLPTEDDFLRLEDMEKFVQHGEAAGAAGDLGGFENFGDFLEGNEIGGDAGDEEDDEVDMYGGWEDGDDAEPAGDSEDEDEGMRDGSAIKYEDFFGQSKPYKRLGGARAERQVAPLRRGDDEGAAAAQLLHAARAAGDGGESDGSDGEAAGLSAHERRQRKIAAQIAQLEEDAMQDKSWHLRGEATAAQRPKDSALEIDVDFERTTRPPPEPTFEAAVALEDIVKARILELRFDNVVRVVPAGPKKERRTVTLDDAKAKQGLADEYEADLQRTVAGTTEDRNAATRKEIKDLFTKLSAKLDALSHLGLAAKPVVTEMEVKVDAPAIAMEEAAPVTMSTASMKVPEEAYAQVRKQRQLKADSEKTQSERHQARASKKRIGKRKRQEKEEAAGVYAHEKGVKSAREDAAAEREARMAKKQQGGGRKDAKKQKGPTTAAAVFKQLQDESSGVTTAKKNGQGDGVRSVALMM